MSAFSGIAGAAMPDSVEARESVPIGGGWRARLFVTPPAAQTRAAQPGVDARLTHHLAKGLTFSVDMKNLFDRPDQGPPVNPFTDSVRAGRGIGFQLKKTF